MDIRINTDSIADWKVDLVGNKNATFIWISANDGATERASNAANVSGPDQARIPLHREPSFLWLADVNDVVMPNYRPSAAFIEYVTRIRSFCPRVLVANDGDPTLRLMDRILNSPETRHELDRLRAPDTYFYPITITSEMETLSRATSIPVVGPASRRIDDDLNSKCFGRQLCKDLDIAIPSGVECNTVGELRMALSEKASMALPLLAKEAQEGGGEGHVLIATQDDAQSFLHRFATLQDCDAVSYVIEAFLDVPPSENFNVRLLVNQAGKIALTDLHRSWVYPPHFFARKTESPHSYDAQTTRDIYRATEKLATELLRLGLWGSYGIDGVRTRGGDIFPALDINPRLTGDVWMTNLVQQFGLSHHCMEQHAVTGVPIAVTFGDVDAALARIGDPSRREGGVVVMTFKQNTTALMQALGKQTLDIKTLTFGNSLEQMRRLAADVGTTLQATFCHAERLDAA